MWGVSGFLFFKKRDGLVSFFFFVRPRPRFFFPPGRWIFPFLPFLEIFGFPSFPLKHRVLSALRSKGGFFYFFEVLGTLGLVLGNFLFLFWIFVLPPRVKSSPFSRKWSPLAMGGVCSFYDESHKKTLFLPPPLPSPRVHGAISINLTSPSFFPFFFFFSPVQTTPPPPVSK